ncbi:membrane bound c-di-GMP receptor LapD [Photobacterium aphoticum]|uniref:Membrane bound c-di-GMP receptor LapD n=1 Tax=Photobacterium aphoticum TaxID=754436 RepID=A0A090R3E7_9GAMM|nr:membrane bound c-di-GMP receptor LapD [Photobacterium aphoticum]
MSLYKRILISVLSVFAALYGIVFYIQYSSVKNYLNEQQFNSVNNTVSSLSLVIPYQYEQNDNTGIEAAIFAAFDSGYYKEISFQLYKDDSFITRLASNDKSNVPSWFSQYVGFSPAHEKVVITSGWTQIGELVVTSNTNMAEEQLWQSTFDLSLWFFAGFLATALFINRMIEYILRPLGTLTRYAEQLGNNNFDASVSKTSVTELRTLNQAMQKMASKLKSEYERQQHVVESLRKQVQQDGVSGLGNRGHFTDHVSSYLSETKSCTGFLITCDSFEELYQHYGFEARDKVVKQVGCTLNALVDDTQLVALSRISAAEFTVCLPPMTVMEAEKFAKRVHLAVKQAFAPYTDLTDIKVYVGGAVTDTVASPTQLLSMVDNAMQAARGLAWGYSIHQDDHNAFSKSQWLNKIKYAIGQKNYQLRSIPTLSLTGKRKVHDEIFISICDEDKIYHAGEFVHIIEQHQLCAIFDRSVVEYITTTVTGNKNIAINLMANTFATSSFVDWFDIELQKNKDAFRHCTFEIPENAFIHFGQTVSEFVAILNKYRLFWGVDNFGRHYKSLNVVVQYKPHYVKLDYLYVSMLSRQQSCAELIEAIIKSAHNLDIDVYATRIENNVQKAKFIELGVDGYQGYITKSQSFVTE